MFCQRFAQCSRVGYFHGPMVALVARANISRCFSTTRNRALDIGALGWPWQRAPHDETIPEPAPEDMEYIGQGINRGDRLAGGTGRIQSPTNRRALIVAPRYEDHAHTEPQTFARMPYTVRDAKLIHQTLVRRGYEPGNIRILADGYPQFHGVTDPTRQNVLDSLKWLIDGTQPEDYRFFYFSGHGERILSKQGQGKQARRVNEGSKPGSNDTERLAYGNKPPTESPLKQVILEKEIAYYNEAIITSLSTSLNSDGTSGVYFRIEDRELNTLFAQLPTGSNLTCVIDCCASGRIINNSVKVAGAGFRGPKTQGIKGTFQSIIDGAQNLPSRIKQTIIPPKITMEEMIPLDERNMDRITANVLTWAACHQRQDSVPYTDNTSGLFTRLWTEAVDKDIDGTMLVEDLYNTVSSKALELGIPKHTWQYLQLWTSMGHEDMAIKSTLMKNCVVI